MVSNGPMVPSRVKVGVLGCVGCVLMYFLRSNLSIAIIAMVEETPVVEDRAKNISDDLCYDVRPSNHTQNSTYHGTIQWSKSVQGVILGSYFWGYTITNALGCLADKFGAKWVAGFGVFVPAICNALIPVFSDIHYSLVIVMRILMGVFHGVILSSLISLFVKWFPQNEKNLAITGAIFSCNLGGFIVLPLAGYLIQLDSLGGWPTVFYITSSVHVLWFILWVYYVSNSPEEDRNISEKELKYISDNNPNSKKVKKLSIPWIKIFTSKVVWASVVAKSTGGFGYFLLCTNMPKYLYSVFGISINKISLFNSLMYACYCAALLAGGPLSTWFSTKSWFTQTRNRKNFQSLAMFGCAVCLLLVPIVGCNSDAVVALLLSGLFMYGFNSGGEFGSIPEFAQNYSGTIFGLANSMAAAAGFVGPMLAGYLLDHGEGSIRKQWNLIWYISAALYAVGGAFYELFGTTDPQPWAIVSNQEKQMSKIKINTVSEHYKA